jgi:transcriptional regulator with XRE-family HTH domain
VPGHRSPRFFEAARIFSEKVYAVRRARGLTQEQLGEMTGMSRNQIQNIEHNRSNARDQYGNVGTMNARLDTVFSLASALGVDVTYLVDPDRPIEPIPGSDTARQLSDL